MYEHERVAESQGYRCIAGVDEAGRGPLAGPVVAAAVVLAPGAVYPGLTDSKKLTPLQREKLYEALVATCTGYGIGSVDEQTIDKINILQASLLAMRRAVEQLPAAPDLLLIDGNRAIGAPMAEKTIVGGDGLSASIAAASVLAKVTRDRLMDGYHDRYPEYDFIRHKGYGTRLHRERIRVHGPCPIHRRTFRGVKEFV